MKKSSVLITGGSSGIGRACVRKFAQDGYETWFTYRSGKDRAEALLSELPGKRVRAFELDQGDPESIDRLVRSLPGPVDILIPNAALGSATVKSYAPDSRAQDVALMQVNALGALWLAEALIPSMLEKEFGKIVFLSSVGGGIRHFPGFRPADGMSKAAVAFLARQLAAVHAHTAVDVFCLCPGATETAMFEASTLSHFDTAGRKAFAESLPKHRLIAPEEIADLAHFLCQDAARVLHGAVLDASLGLGVADPKEMAGDQR